MKKKIDFIASTLNKFFEKPEIPLLHKDPYTLLIATLLSAQCTDVRVNQVTPLLFKKAPTPYQMILLSEEEIFECIKSLGLAKTKAKHILKLSFLLIEKFQGEVPSNFKDLESLPGVGHKTASVVMVQAFKQEAFPVDTHIFRVARRWGLSKGSTVEAVEKDLKKIFKKSDWGKVHLQMVLFGRHICTAKKHVKETCPICSHLDLVGKEGCK